MNPRLQAILPGLSSALLAVALYAVTLGGTYIYDDFDILFNDPRVSHPDQWKLYWTQSYNGGVDNLYRPLVSMTYAVQWWLHGDKAWAFHLVNLLLNALVCALVAELARRLSGTRVAYVAGLLFAAHPIHVEAVANIVGRAELLCAAGTLGALVLFVHRPLTIGRAIAITACFIVALLSKEQGMLLPLLLLILHWCMRRAASASAGRVPGSHANSTNQSAEANPASLDYAHPDTSTRQRVERHASLILVLLLCWFLAGYIILREQILKFWWDRSFLDPTIQPMILSQGINRWLMPLVLLGSYKQLLMFPTQLSPDYGGSVIGSVIRWNDVTLYIGALAAAVWITLLTFALRKRRGVMVFCLLSIAITYAPVSNLVTLIGTNFGERLAYLPSAFVVIVLSNLINSLPRRAAIAIAAVLLSLASIRTVTYAVRWNDRLVFYEKSLEEQPNSIRLQMLVASELMSRGKLDEAAQAAARGRTLMPGYNEVWIQSGVIALAQDKLDDADRYLDTAMHLRPSLKALGWKGKVSARRASTQATTNPR